MVWDDNAVTCNRFKDENEERENGFSPNFIVVWRQLVEELLHAVLLPNRVHIRHLVVRQGGEEQMHLGWSIFRLFRSHHLVQVSFSWGGSRVCVCLLQWRQKVLINGGLKSEGGSLISQLDTGLNACFKIKPMDSIVKSSFEFQSTQV